MKSRFALGRCCCGTGEPVVHQLSFQQARFSDYEAGLSLNFTWDGVRYLSFPENVQHSLIWRVLQPFQGPVAEALRWHIPDNIIPPGMLQAVIEFDGVDSPHTPPDPPPVNNMDVHVYVIDGMNTGNGFRPVADLVNDIVWTIPGGAQWSPPAEVVSLPDIAAQINIVRAAPGYNPANGVDVVTRVLSPPQTGSRAAWAEPPWISTITFT